MYNHQKIKKKRDAWLTLIAMLFIIAAWIAGGLVENADILSSVKEKMPDIAKFEELESSTYKIYNAEDTVLGYLSVESAMGYGGPLQIAVAVDQDGKIFDLAVVSSKETPSYLEKVLDTDFLDDIIGKSFTDTYTIGVDIDGISSATYSSNAILEASKMGDRYVAAKILGFDVPEKESPNLQFGGAEIVLILLFVISYFAHKKTFKFKKIARWGTMLVGLFVLGFFYNKPFTLSMINQLLLGYFPPLHSHLYWYLLLFGVFFVFTVDNKNPYCQWFCPFGAAQECMGLVGGAKHRSVGKFKNIFKWSLRIITLFAIIMALLLRNPGVTSYEIFGTLFKLTGSNFQFAILGIILVASMFIKRPWCTYLCPLGPVTDHFSHLRSLVIGKWKTSMQKNENV